MDKTLGYGEQQRRRDMAKEDRQDDSDLDERLADGYEMLEEDDKEDISPAARSMVTFKNDVEYK